jgi:hypothetical protein
MADAAAMLAFIITEVVVPLASRLPSPLVVGIHPSGFRTSQQIAFSWQRRS